MNYHTLYKPLTSFIVCNFELIASCQCEVDISRYENPNCLQQNILKTFFVSDKPNILPSSVVKDGNTWTNIKKVLNSRDE